MFAVISASANKQTSPCDDPDLPFLVYSLKFLSHLFHNLTYKPAQQEIVQLVFSGLQRWTILIDQHHPNAIEVFQAISHLFRSTMNAWAPKVYTKMRERFAYENAQHKSDGPLSLSEDDEDDDDH